MQTEAVFENIAERIESEIGKAQKSIFIAIAWFTNKNLFNALLKKAKEGCKVSLLVSDDEINTNSRIDFSELENYNSKCFKVGNGDTELMHNKFCVIDYSTVITGSYNWSYKAETNFENVIINYNDTALAEQFIAEFNHIRKQYHGDAEKDEKDFPLQKIISRLEILKNYILLEDVDELRATAKKLKEYNFNADISDIVRDVEQRAFSSAINRIQKFISQNQQLTVWSDYELLALKLEIKNLENQLNAFDNEKTEIEKVISDFNHRHALELGSVVLEILKLRKLKFKKNKKEFEEAEKDEKQYRQQIEEEKEKKQFELTEEEKKELKHKFRKATFLCHPDKVNDDKKELANKMFIELKDAYDTNNLRKVSEILEQLEKGNFFKSFSDTVSEKLKLKSLVAELRQKLQVLEKSIQLLKDHETYKTIISITNWDEYFITTKEKLEQELTKLKKEISKI